MMTCQRCHAAVQRVILRAGALWCGSCCVAESQTQRAHGVIRDEIPGGFVQENFGHTPETFYSWSAMRKRADELGLQPFVKQLEQGKESHYIDAYTLANAAELLSRSAGKTTTTQDHGRLETLQVSWNDWTFDDPDSRR